MTNPFPKLNTPRTRNNLDVNFCCKSIAACAIIAIASSSKVINHHYVCNHYYVYILRTRLEVSIHKKFRISRTRLFKTTSAITRLFIKPTCSQDSEHTFCVLARFLFLKLKKYEEKNHNKVGAIKSLQPVESYCRSVPHRRSYAERILFPFLQRRGFSARSVRETRRNACRTNSGNSLRRKK